MTDNILTIDLNESYKVVIEKDKKYKGAKFFKSIYESAENHISKIIEKNREGRKGNKRSSEYMNNIIAFCGERGTGKSSAMLSVKHALKDRNTIDQKISEHVFHTLPTIDPTLMEGDDNIMEVVLANMFHDFKERLDSDHKTSQEKKREVLKSFEEVYKNLRTIHRIDDALNGEYLEALSALSSGTKLKQNFRKLVEDFLSFYEDRKFLVVAIDDFDLNITKAYEMAEQVRKYMQTDNVIILMAVKMDQMHEAVEQGYWKQFADKKKLSGKDLDEDPNQMAERYLEKLIPLDRRLYMPEMRIVSKEKQLILLKNIADKEREVFGKFTDENGENRYMTIEETILKLINEKTNLIFLKPKYGKHYLVPENLRGLHHLLNFLDGMPTLGINDKKEDLIRNLLNHNDLPSDLLNVEFKNEKNETIETKEEVIKVAEDQFLNPLFNHIKDDLQLNSKFIYDVDRFKKLIKKIFERYYDQGINRVTEEVLNQHLEILKPNKDAIDLKLAHINKFEDYLCKEWVQDKIGPELIDIVQKFRNVHYELKNHWIITEIENYFFQLDKSEDKDEQETRTIPTRFFKVEKDKKLKTFTQLISKENKAYNMSMGDVYYYLSVLTKYRPVEELRYFKFALKTLYTISYQKFLVKRNFEAIKTLCKYPFCYESNNILPRPLERIRFFNVKGSDYSHSVSYLESFTIHSGGLTNSNDGTIENNLDYRQDAKGYYNDFIYDIPKEKDVGLKLGNKKFTIDLFAIRSIVHKPYRITINNDKLYIPFHSAELFSYWMDEMIKNKVEFRDDNYSSFLKKLGKKICTSFDEVLRQNSFIKEKIYFIELNEIPFLNNESLEDFNNIYNNLELESKIDNQTAEDKDVNLDAKNYTYSLLMQNIINALHSAMLDIRSYEKVQYLLSKKITKASALNKWNEIFMCFNEEVRKVLSDNLSIFLFILKRSDVAKFKKDFIKAFENVEVIH
ncbi:hypothetical protein [Aureibacter tunicatorum]|uniref:Uncharacterized protein n=1 Tax=Aureibacter tunicatorum TaxID=866807 RepID=A0AAE3XS55_9BACT|nr:hypothetical protein [Aureibacter tunicatorum]MDR6240484.1 hypothetical protein [Aureibacter tunicatorum]BDD06653.1 hypothetical protein AUTU_41360 [Aureibacter tunicatorum]